LDPGFCLAPVFVCPVHHSTALLLAHCLAARPLPPALPVADLAKPPEYLQNLPVDALRHDSQDGAVMNESEKQFSFIRAALSKFFSPSLMPLAIQDLYNSRPENELARQRHEGLLFSHDGH